MIIIPVARLEKGDVTLDGVMTPAEMKIKDNDFIQFIDSVTYNLQAKLVSGGILLDGVVASKVHCLCGRCTADLELVVANDQLCHFYEDIDVQELDVTDDIREDLLIMLPMNPLCSETCCGLCSHCGANLNNEKCDCVDEEIVEDDIWGDLDKLDFND